MLPEVWEWIRTHILRRKPSEWVKKETKISFWTKKGEHEAELELPQVAFRPKHGKQEAYIDKIEIKPKAIHQDVSKFMKHGRQAPWYRKSMKERKNPEED